EALALRDPLTGLGNRRVLDAKLRRIFARPPIARQDTAVIICDVDGLKDVNDNLGHAAGDAVLLEAADALRLAVAGIVDATVCRIGGDEFCVVIDGGGLLQAEPVAERAQRLFARIDTRSMSCGIAIATINMHTPGDLLRAADEAQYLQKRQRRGLAVVPGEEVDHPRRRYRDR
ncbi:MAG TPA: GGDEF domain-containing protein, partial [Acidimicrobiales bacterium]|nr:GGDEF domain-containing protein [Acidimicrobiales bacterium]